MVTWLELASKFNLMNLIQVLSSLYCVFAHSFVKVLVIKDFISFLNFKFCY